MLLVDSIKNTTTAIQRRRNAQESKQSAATYASALRQLSLVSDSLRTAMTCAESMKTKKIVDHPVVPSQTRDDLVDCINNCGKAISDVELTPDMVSILKAKTDNLSGQILIAWKEASVNYSEGTRGYLSMIGGLTDNPKAATELSEKIKGLTESSVSLKNIDDLVESVSKAKTLTDSFSLNADIEVFLKKVSSRQATIRDLTPGILKWLKEKNLMDKLNINY